MMMTTAATSGVVLAGVAAGALVVDVVDLQEPGVVGGRC